MTSRGPAAGDTSPKRWASIDRADPIATAVSEIARNAFIRGRRRVEYAVEGETAPQVLSVRIADSGPGIANLREILAGDYQSASGLGIGLTGALRLVDRFTVSSTSAGTIVKLAKLLPARAPLFAGPEVTAGRHVTAATSAPPRKRSAESGTASRAGRPAPAAGGAAARQPRARRHQPRRRRALRRARRTRRSPATRRRNQDPVPVEHDARVPDAGELDSRADAAACRTDPVRREREERALLHPQVGAAALGSRGRPARPGKGRSRQDRRQAGLLRGPGALRRAARHAPAAARQPVAEPRLRRAGGRPAALFGRDEGLAGPP